MKQEGQPAQGRDGSEARTAKRRIEAGEAAGGNSVGSWVSRVDALVYGFPWGVAVVSSNLSEDSELLENIK